MKNICFQMNRKMWLTMLMALCLALPALAQKVAIQGKVVDSAGEPLIGASVLAQGTTVGVATDFDGNFTIQVAPDATLVVSYVGYEPQTVTLTEGQTRLVVTLQESSLMLDEVVAIGYGTVKKEDATGSVATVKPTEIQAGLSSSVQDLLVGQTPGVVVTPSAGPEGSGTIRIRGGSSLNASNDPLIVLDGVPLSNQGTQGMGNALAMISPDNIESMTILKDASATAIYGSRASNGVIIITTKKGKEGKVQVNFTANMTVQTARKTWDVLTGDEYRDVMTRYWGAGSAAAKALGSANTDWQDEVLRTSISHDYSLSVGGKTGFLPYRVAVTYTGNNGIIRNTSMDRVTAGFNLTPEFFDGKLKVQANVKGYYIENEFADTGSAVGGALASDPTSPVYTDYPMADGSVGELFNGYTSQMNDDQFNINGVNNPVAALEQRSDIAKVWRSNGNLQLDYALHFLPELRFNLNLGYDISKTDEHIITEGNSPAMWDANYQDGAGTDYYVYQYRANTLLDFYANYKKYFDVIKSDIDVTAGYSWQYFYSKGHNNGTLFTTPGYIIDQQADGNYLLTHKTGADNHQGQTYTNPAESYLKNHYQLVSFFGRLNYTLMNRYLLTFTMRGDGTSRFSKDNRWGVFPSIALGWKISDEAWMEGTKDWMNELKLRLGWGVTGQQDINDNYFPYMAIYKQSTIGSYYPSLTGERNPDGSYVYLPTLYPQGYDSDLKWEETTTWNAGLDFGFLNNRITASLDWYYRETKDLLSYVTVPLGAFTTNMLYQNIGTLENMGVEFGITARPIVTKDFTWTLTYNVAWNRNKITKLNSDGSYVTTGADIAGGTGNKVQVHAVGHPASSFYLLEQVYDEAGNPIEGVFVDQDGDGDIDDDDKIIKHSPDPKVTMTFGSTFNYKNWDFGFNLRASIGNYVYANVHAERSILNRTFQNSGLSNLIDSDFYFDGSLTSQNLYMSDYWLRNASFLRCENITIGYTWPSLLKDQLRLRLYGAVQNPFVITKYDGLDPEVYGGIDNNVYPRPVTFNIGVVATF